MEITTRLAKGATVLTLKGDLNFGARPVFKAAIDKAIAGKSPHVILNLEGVAFMDSAALGLLVLTHQNCKKEHVRLSLVKPQTAVQAVLNLANIPKMIPIFATENEALSATPVGV
jgi:anti-anti-sigma factor